jgi:pimeloyl-ACP methyl ester carboxylesterase
MSPGFSEGSTDADGTQVRYIEAGRGDPVVILHGEAVAGPTTLDELLADGYHVVALKVPGVRATAQPLAAAARNLARTMSRAAAQVGLARYRLVSDTEGSAVALWQAIDFPEQVESLVLIAPQPAESDASGELANRLGDVKAPTLLVFGTRDTAISPSTGRFYRERIPNSHYVLIYEAGHAVEQDRPQALLSLLTDFLERGEAFIVSRANTLINP